MRKLLLTSAVALLGLAAIPASAFPVAPLSDSAASFTPIAFGCGAGWTRGPYGHCHPMGYGAVAPRPYGFVAPVPGVVVGVPGPYYGVHRCWIGPLGHRHCN